MANVWFASPSGGVTTDWKTSALAEYMPADLASQMTVISWQLPLTSRRTEGPRLVAGIRFDRQRTIERYGYADLLSIAISHTRGSFINSCTVELELIASRA